MISKTYYRYIWLLDTLLNSSPLTIDEINMLWEDCPLSNGPIPLRTFHEQRKEIKKMFGVEIVCDRSHGNVYYVKNPEVLDKQKVAKWLLHKYSIPQGFATFNSMKDRVLQEEIPLGTTFLNPISLYFYFDSVPPYERCSKYAIFLRHPKSPFKKSKIPYLWAL